VTPRHPRQGSNAASSIPVAASRRAANQKSIAFSGLLWVTKSGIPWYESMWLKSSTATPRKQHARMRMPTAVLRSGVSQATAKTSTAATIASVSSAMCSGR
jgi:hypothetical protein